MLLKYVDLPALREDLRKIGAAFITGGVIGVFMTHFVNLILAGWLTFLSVILLLTGLIKLRDRELS